MTTKNPTKRIRPLKLTSSSRTLAAKFYDDQLPNGEDAFIDAVKNTSSNERQILAVKHTKSVQKEHWHLIERLTDDSNNIYVNTALHDLGIYYRKGKDDSLIKKHGLETVGWFENYAAYLLHITDEAKADNKPEYKAEDIVSNLPLEEVKKIIAGYAPKKQRMTRKDYVGKAKQAGENLLDFDLFINSFPMEDITINLRKAMLTEYKDSAERQLKKQSNINRLNVYICCKSDDIGIFDKVMVIAKQALSEKKAVIYPGEATNIRFDTEAIICKGRQNACSTKRIIGISLKNDYRFWRGHYQIVVGSDNEIYVSGYSRKKLKTEYRNDYFICHIEDGKLIPDYGPEVNREDEKELTDMYIEFRDSFNEAFSKYKSDINDTVRIDIDALK